MDQRQAIKRSLAGVTAAILAGGLGTRLLSLVADRPKALAEIQGRPFLSYLLDLYSIAEQFFIPQALV
jgi:NDP-sugar pyrophosphorylase family protein